MGPVYEVANFIFYYSPWLLAFVCFLSYLRLARRLGAIESWLIDFLKSSETTGRVFVGARVWNEELYLVINPDVAAEVSKTTFSSGREHYEVAGRAEQRQGGWVPTNWDEELYLKLNTDVARAVFKGQFLSGYHHYLAAGAVEGRPGGLPNK